MVRARDAEDMSTQRRMILSTDRLPAEGGLVSLRTDEQRYLRKVLRLQVGSELQIRDGNGGEWPARIMNRATLSLGSRQQLDRAILPFITLNFCPPKGRRLDLLLEKATELGCFALRPIRTERSVRIVEKLTERWSAVIMAAGAQSGVGWLPVIEPPISFSDVNPPVERLNLIAHPSGTPFASALKNQTLPSHVDVFTGPEGGFTDAEVRQATQQGMHPISLGPTILRAETAPIVALSMIHALTWRG